MPHRHGQVVADSSNESGADGAKASGLERGGGEVMDGDGGQGEATPPSASHSRIGRHRTNKETTTERRL